MCFPNILPKPPLAQLELPGKTGCTTNYRIVLPFLLLCLLFLVTPQIRRERQFEAHWNMFAHLFLDLLSDWNHPLWTRCPSPGELGECDCTNVLVSLRTQQEDLLFIQLHFMNYIFTYCLFSFITSMASFLSVIPPWVQFEWLTGWECCPTTC